MLDNNNPIEIDIISSEISAFENGRINSRIVLGYIGGEFTKLKTSHNLFVSVYFQRNIDMDWESVTFQLNNDEKYFYQKLPAGLTVISFYVRLYGLISDEFELVNLKILIDEIPIGKAGGESLLLLDKEGVLENIGEIPQYVKFEIKIPLVGSVMANSAEVVFATTHEATSRVIYGLSPLTMINEKRNEEFKKYHSLLLQNLQLEAPYFCQIFSVSEQTGEEIQSGIIQFFTGKEITLQSVMKNPYSNYHFLQKNELIMENHFSGNNEIKTTFEADGEGESKNDIYFSLHAKTEIGMSNTIGNELQFTVTP